MEKKKVQAIKKKDNLWKEASKDSKLIQNVLRSNESLMLKKLMKSFKFANEAFIFNYQGAILGGISKTSDFDQSDEEKYRVVKNQKEFNQNNITELYFDSSSGSFQIGIMIRLEDGQKEFSGGIYIGANINKLLTHYKIN